MLAPRGARWVEERGGHGESALSYEQGALTMPAPLLHPTPAKAGVPACSLLRVVFANFVTSC